MSPFKRIIVPLGKPQAVIRLEDASWKPFATVLGPDGRVVHSAHGPPKVVPVGGIFTVRDRHAPSPRVSAGIEGWVSWGLYDRKGRQVQGGEQHNLILNGMLDDIATNTVTSGTGGGSRAGISAFPAYLTHFAVGTGSTAPDVTQTALVSELARTTTEISYTVTRPSNGVYNLALEREFDFGVGNGNLTEFGFARGASANMLVRELFRNEGGTPITVTKTSDFKLRIKYTLTITLTPVTLTEASFNISGIGTINGDHAWVGAAAGSNMADLATFARLARGLTGTGINSCQGLLSTSSTWSYATNIDGEVASGGGIATSMTPNGYTSEDYARSVEAALWSTANGNVTGIRSISAQWGGNTGGQVFVGWRFVIDSGDAFTKDNLHMLTLDDMLNVSWDRAA